MKIEKALKKLAENDSSCPALVILKANNGFSVVPLDQKFYAEHIILREHYNGPSVLAALKEFIHIKQFKTENILKS